MAPLFFPPPLPLYSPPLGCANFTLDCNYFSPTKAVRFSLLSPVRPFIALVCLNMPCGRQATYLFVLPLSGVVRQRRGREKNKERGKIRAKRPVPKADRLPTGIYLQFSLPHTHSELDGARQQRNTHSHGAPQQWHTKPL